MLVFKDLIGTAINLAGHAVIFDCHFIHLRKHDIDIINFPYLLDLDSVVPGDLQAYAGRYHAPNVFARKLVLALRAEDLSKEHHVLKALFFR